MPDYSVTVQNVVLDLLQYIGVTSLQAPSNSNALNRPGIINEDIYKAIRAINAALGEILEKGPIQATTRTRRSELLNAGTGVIISVTQNSKDITFVSGQADWMVGCSIQIGGDSYMNEIVSFEGATAKLLRQYLGSTQVNLPAQVWGDAVVLPDDTNAVIEPVQIMPNRNLVPAQSRQHFDRFSYQANSESAPYTYIMKTTGWPILYLAEGTYDPLLPYMPIILRVNPMPNQAMTITYVAERKFTKVSMDDIGLDGNDPGVTFSGNCSDWLENILLPIARKRFSAHPAWKNREARPEIMDQYKQAIALLESPTLSKQIGSQKAVYL